MPSRGGARILALAVLLVLAAPSARAEAVGSVAPAARGLQDSRLYVAPAVAETVDARTRRALVRRLRAREEPILVALVAFAPGDAFDGDGPSFLTALAGRLRKPGVYVTYDGRGILWTRGHRVARATAETASVASRIVNLEDRFDSPPGPRLTHFLEALDDADLEGRERRAVAAFEQRTGSSTATAPAAGTPERDDEGSAISGGLLAAILGGAVVIAGLGLLIARRRRRARHVDDRPLLPGRVFELAREASRDELAERADAMLIALSGLIDAAPPDAGTQRALDAYEAAGRALRAGERDIPDLVGALVCIDLGRNALSRGADPPPPCTYDPRHGAAQGSPVTVEDAELRLCKACRRDAAAGRPADVLRDGRGEPYLDADTPWSRSGYGAWGDPVSAVLDTRRYSQEVTLSARPAATTDRSRRREAPRRPGRARSSHPARA